MVLVVRAGRLVVRSWQRLVVVVVVTAAACSLIFINRCRLAPDASSGPVYSGLSGPALSARALVDSPHRARSLTLNIGRPALEPAHHPGRQASRSSRATFHLHSGSEGRGPARDDTHTAREIFHSPRESLHSFRVVNDAPIYHPREGFQHDDSEPNIPLVTSRNFLFNQPPPSPPGRSSLGHAPHSALSEDEEQRTAYTRRLLQQIALLEQEVASLHAAAAIAGVSSDKPSERADQLVRREALVFHAPNNAQKSDGKATRPPVHHGSSHFAAPPPALANASRGAALSSEAACSATLQQQILQSEVVRGLPLNNEYEVVPFSHFSWSRVYPSELGLGKRVVEKPIGYRRKDVLAALTAALEHLNGYQNHGYRYSMDDFIEGSFRTIPTAGTQYELVFRDGARPNTFSSNDNNNNNYNNSNVAFPATSNSGHDNNNNDGKKTSSQSSTDGKPRVNSRGRRGDVVDVGVDGGISGVHTRSGGDTNLQKPSDSIYNKNINVNNNVDDEDNNDNINNNPSVYNFHNTGSKKDGFHDTKSSESSKSNIRTSIVRNTTGVNTNGGDGGDDVRQKKMAPETSGTKNGTSRGKHARQASGAGASLKVVTLMRPFAPITVVRSKTNSARQLINIILPLSGRLQTFQRFMTKLTTVILPHDRRIFLTVVYFGDVGLQRARNIITKASREANFRMVKLLTLNETFSRGKALQELDQLVISRDTGFWRDFGYGMTCQYRSDFLSVNGFDQEIVGWGGEDVLLYRKYVRSSLAVIRSTDPGIFHLWHPKLCSSGLPGDQYRACLSSRALSEASHAHLGLVAFKKDLEKHPVGSQILPGITAAEKNLNTAGGYQNSGA